MLIIEDNDSDVFLIQEAIKGANLPVVLQVVEDGERAAHLFDRLDQDASLACPSIVILDINLPRKQGSEVLEHIRRSARCPDVLVIAVSTSNSPQDRELMIGLGANGYFRKPSEYDEFMRLGDVVKTLLNDSSPKEAGESRD